MRALMLKDRLDEVSAYARSIVESMRSSCTVPGLPPASFDLEPELFNFLVPAKCILVVK